MGMLEIERELGSAGGTRRGRPPRAAFATAEARVGWDPRAEAYLLSAARAHYRVRPVEGRARLWVEGRSSEAPEDAWLPLATLGLGGEDEGSGCTVRHTLRGRLLSVRFEGVAGGAGGHYYQLRTIGEALEIQVNAPGVVEQGAFMELSIALADGAQVVRPPGTPVPVLLFPGGTVAAAYVDPVLSQGTACQPGGALYLPGPARDLTETVYCTLSSDPMAVLPALRAVTADHTHPESLIGRLVLDWQSSAPFDVDEGLLRALTELGLTEVLLIYRDWQQYGLGRRDPALYPANPERGGGAGLRSCLQAARLAGWGVALREEYAVVDPRGSYPVTEIAAHFPDGSPRPAAGGDGYALAAGQMLAVARLEASAIARNYPTTATYIDRHTVGDPELELQQSDLRGTGAAPGVGGNMRLLRQLCDYLRTCGGGPVIGRAARDRVGVAVGLADAVIGAAERPGEGPSLAVDYLWEDVRPNLLGFETAAPEEADRTRAARFLRGEGGGIAFRPRPGARGGLPPDFLATVFRAYWLETETARRLQQAGHPVIRYAQGDDWLTLAEAMAAGVDLTQPYAHLEFPGGLGLWVNASRDNRPVNFGAFDGVLPTGGFYLRDDAIAFIAYSAWVQDRRVDLLSSPDVFFLDARGGQQTAFGVATDGAVALRPGLTEAEPPREVMAVDSRLVTVSGEEYRLPERGSFRIRHVGPGEWWITVLDTASGKPALISWPAPDLDSAVQFVVDEQQGTAWVPSRAQVHRVRTGVQLSRAVPGVRYRVSGR